MNDSDFMQVVISAIFGLPGFQVVLHVIKW